MKNLSLYIDLAFCIVVLPVMMMIFPVERWFHNFPWYVVSAGCWFYILYFLNRFVTVRCLFGSRRLIMAGVALIIVSLAVNYAFSCTTLYHPRPSIHDAGVVRHIPGLQQYQQAIWSLFMIVETFSFAVGLLTQAHLQRSCRREAEAERDRAEIELYKAQIKPHFMFNTLNSLYGLFLTKNDNALPSLEKFIAMMRYLHYSSLRELVPLVDEADYIRRYVDLQSLRLNAMTSVETVIEVEDADVMIPPMLLVTFVENCFKHGVSSVERSMIHISLRKEGRHVVFSTRNRIFPSRHLGEHQGISNCRRRLSLLYPDRYRLTVVTDGACFSVDLEIDL